MINKSELANERVIMNEFTGAKACSFIITLSELASDTIKVNIVNVR
jgi:hypothetical protein